MRDSEPPAPPPPLVEESGAEDVSVDGEGAESAEEGTEIDPTATEKDVEPPQSEGDETETAESNAAEIPAEEVGTDVTETDESGTGDDAPAEIETDETTEPAPEEIELDDAGAGTVPTEEDGTESVDPDDTQVAEETDLVDPIADEAADTQNAAEEAEEAVEEAGETGTTELASGGAPAGAFAQPDPPEIGIPAIDEAAPEPTEKPRRERSFETENPAFVRSDGPGQSARIVATHSPTVIETQVRQSAMAIVPASAARKPGPDDEDKMELPFDPWRLPEAVRRRWYWLVIVATLFGLGGGVVGYVRARYFLVVTMTLRDISSPFTSDSKDSESYKPPALSRNTLIDFLTSTALFRHVGQLAAPPVSEKYLRSVVSAVPERNSELVNVNLVGKDQAQLVMLANLLASNAVVDSKEAMRENPLNLLREGSNSLAETSRKLDDLKAEMVKFRMTTGIMSPELEENQYVQQYNKVMLERAVAVQRLEMIDVDSDQARISNVSSNYTLWQDKLTQLQAKGYLDKHPQVVNARAMIDLFHKQLEELINSGRQKPEPTAATNVAVDTNSPAISVTNSVSNTTNLLSPTESAESELQRKPLELAIKQYDQELENLKKKVSEIDTNAVKYVDIKYRIDYQEKIQDKLNSRQFQAADYLRSVEGYYEVPSVVSIRDVDHTSRYKRIGFFGVGGAFVGFAITLAIVLLLEVFDPRLKTVADVKRVTHLPVLATLGDLKKMDAAAKKAWAFRTWTILSGTLSESANRGTVCGIISCTHGEGRSTWVELLVDAARQRGFEVTKLDFGHADKASEALAGSKGRPGFKPGFSTEPRFSKPVTPGGATRHGPEAAFAGGGGARGEEAGGGLVTASSSKLAAAQATAVIHVQLPGLVWNLERRIQFQEQLEKWQMISHTVVLIDLPPAIVPEAILLAENLPQVLWLVDSGKTNGRETRLHLETLRHARCKLVGAVLNHEPDPLIKL